MTDDAQPAARRRREVRRRVDDAKGSLSARLSDILANLPIPPTKPEQELFDPLDPYGYLDALEQWEAPRHEED